MRNRSRTQPAMRAVIGRRAKCDTDNGGGEQFSLEERICLHLEVVEVVLQSGVRVGIAVGKVVDVAFLVEAESKRHDVVLAMFWTAVIVDVPVWNPHPGHTQRLNALHHKGRPKSSASYYRK